MVNGYIVKYREQILYIAFGAATTLVNWVAYALFLRFFILAVSNMIAWIIAVVFAFLVNKVYVFKRGYTTFWETLKELVLFLGARAFSGLFEIFGLPILVYVGLDHTIYGVEGALAKIILSVVVIILNYFFSKFIIFKEKQTPVE